MNFSVSPELKTDRTTIVMPPAVEALQNAEQAATLWPETNAIDHSFAEQIALHEEHIASIDSVLHCLPHPTMSIEAATEDGIVTHNQVSRFYTTLSDVLDDTERSRLVLYLPFEFLPDISWTSEDSTLQQAIERFRDSYLSAWYDLLHIHDVRANFVDGDVLEVAYRSGDPERVVKAAHLLPELVSCGWFTEQEAVRLRDEASDPLLRQSFDEALSALYDLPLQPGMQGEYISAPISDGRQRWLDQKRRNEVIAEAATHVAEAIQTNDSELAITLMREDADSSAAAILAEGVYGAIEQTSRKSIPDARALYENYEQAMSVLWERGTPDLQNRLVRAYRRLYQLGIAQEESLVEKGIDLPTLTGPWSENLPLLAPDIENIRRATERIEADPALCDLVYPVALVGGSRLKGYGERSSDIDINVFVRPGIPESTRSYIRETLGTIFIGDGVQYETSEFWLDQTGDQLTVHGFTHPDVHTAESHWTHILFGTAWVGEQQAITELYNQLLPNYFYESDATLHGRSARGVYIEQLEQDALQYRLMHTGYQRHYPRYSEPRSASIDGSSNFWDSGYRQLATRLFIRHVFLPKLASIET